MKKILALILILLISLLTQNCAMVKISISKKRSSTPRQINIGKNTTMTTWGAIKINKSHFFPSSFQLKSGNRIIYIDPIGIQTTEKADYILITHAHPDHLSKKDLEKILKPETKIICSKGVAKKLKGNGYTIQVIRPNETIDFDGININAIAAYNTKSVFLWIKAHPKSKENVGFVLTLDKKLTIYHAGDTDYIPEMKELKNIQIALIPIGGDNLTMNEEEAALIVNKIKPEKVIPIHYEIKNREELNRFKSLINNVTEVIILE
ncbi:MBL fold metallo-hydrolase [uncultured Psychroserpens sp.]|uniref:MBL fold metallo-hydrolase n=1 Tax=uncultured Psychroserpens sp. TaxID=255436 RepID=UPI00260941CE|nr:MBL fold metallo-hydrolase [uncultured Psychroserpens sp.]